MMTIPSLAVGVAILLRLAATFAVDDKFLTGVFGSGTLPAIRAALTDPNHTWGHLTEACFWLGHSPSSLAGGPSASIYSGVYTSGTHVAASPLVVAYLGETLVCNETAWHRAAQQLLLLAADIVGACCIYFVGKRIIQLESKSREAEIEASTLKEAFDNDKETVREGVIPERVRPERGWVLGLPQKIKRPPEGAKKESACDEGCSNGSSNGSSSTHANGDAGDAGDAQSQTSHPDPSEVNELGKIRKPMLSLDLIPTIASTCYFCNPVSIIANSVGSLRSLWDALLLISMYHATRPATRLASDGAPVKVPTASKLAISLALASYVDVGYAVFLLPVLLWRGMFGDVERSIATRQGRDWRTVFVLFVTYLGTMHYFSSLLVGGDLGGSYTQVLRQTALRNVAFVQLDNSGSVPGPSMGLHWYMFVQMFDRFRPYFTVFVSGLPAMFIVPLMIRLHKYPSVLAAAFQLLWAIFRPTTTVHTFTLGLHLALMNPRSMVRMRDYVLVAFFALPVPILLFVTFHRMWMVTGNGNANYIFFQCYAYGMFVAMITLEFVNATVKRDKVLRMVEKGSFLKLAKEMEERENTAETAVPDENADKDESREDMKKDSSNDATDKTISAVKSSTKGSSELPNDLSAGKSADNDDSVTEQKDGGRREPSIVFL
ncbi:hypothetical protein THAOC_31125 [Thalassiosira oceanica]|uniref:GPI transamidase subunit PIG-U n=1 Tax=Thalassiosira oceanica TaxID=159749 RepID=K0RTC9_THAOC|nr:hypothetical protein THAOC_31125 [Thalassiosira oceanica]|mmetsp:Transcript_1551/g.3710  ORF Transcript_1551/g.3710 Transcript_1551/m.3710 type:complete len:660 (+) Transcript_1551:68-2047(+)|eukprot:EJK49947.1 hypothetical protein THAOC_31125 [Thalassiosira oceanica]